MECTDMREQLLDAWLNLSSTITNERLVSGFSYNEALVMNLLYQQYNNETGRPLTATVLCRQTNILKSQMNAILNALEKKQMILRSRSRGDRRQIEVKLNPEYLDEFIQCHERSLKLAEGVQEQLNEEEAGQAVVMLRHLADCFQAVMDARKLHDKR